MRDILAKQILLIEDESDIRLLYREVLETAGFHVHDYSDGITGLNAVKNREWDLLLLDIMLPGKDGIKILTDLSTTPHLKRGPIVALTNLNSVAIIKEAFSKGIDGYLIKSEITPDMLITEVRTFLGMK